MQTFFTSLTGQIVTALAALLGLLAIAGVTRKQDRNSVKAMVVSAICIALAMALSYVRVFRMPFGGSVTLFSMLFIVLIGYWYGTAQGILAGVTYGLLQLIADPYVVHPIQLLLDYPLAFGMLGLSGLVGRRPGGLYMGVIVGMLGRFLMHVLSGLAFFAMYTPEGWNPLAYSVVYNISYLGVEGMFTLLLLTVPQLKVAINRVRVAA
ncbi:energy-coupled thiamine transporter ThiT [Clostridiales bacterium F-3ap]|uniref:Energy-coupled thiamine transporter ThiT n=2 Tax=Anaerotalea alkaliphila TaxID=2662126 RepID=A0A7X5KMI1_9FIRM|nr:energy-coupled thiamine transporter ThiT [Anaerotalea alkaliphila]